MRATDESMNIKKEASEITERKEKEKKQRREGSSGSVVGNALDHRAKRTRVRNQPALSTG
jgi:hypothetical protein